MTCYHPIIRIEDTWNWKKASDGHRYHPARIVKKDAKNYLEIVSEYQKHEIKDRYKYTQIPCGNCIGCRLEYSRQWANRGYCESKLWKNNWFVTLTYDDEHLKIPEDIEDSSGITWCNDGTWNGTLIKEDLTAFIKSVRQIMKRDYGQDNIRFMACGEYGGQTERPHFHIIFFNLDLPLEDLYEPRLINHEPYYRSHIIERAWTKGISNISECTWNTIAYTARYITKKINGESSEEYYSRKGQIKEFFRVSRMPGIGEGYYRKHWKEIYDRDEIIIKNKQGSIATKPPKYFDRLYEAEHPAEWEEIKARRKKQAQEANKVKDQKTSIFRAEQLEIEERLKDEETQKLIRAMEYSTR